MPTDPDVICAHMLSKKYGTVQAVHDLSFRVPPGSIFGLLGRNGSGKTTTLRLLLGLLRPDAGSSSVFGENSLSLSSPCRQRIGYLSEEPFEFDYLPLPELVRFVAAFFPSWDWEYTNLLIKRFGVPRNRPLRAMSPGERRLTELLLVLAQKPDLLILDDPGHGLDVTVRREFLWAALEVTRNEGKAVLFTSHVLSDVERIVDTVGILDKGRMRIVSRLDDLKARIKRLVLPLDAGSSEPERLSGELSRRRERGYLLVVTETFTPTLKADLGDRFPAVQVEDLNLEDIFCELVPRPVSPVASIDVREQEEVAP